MNSSDKLKDIQCLINEHYSDKEPLKENQRKSKDCFNTYCNDIAKDLMVLEILKKKKVDIKIVPHCNEYFEYNNELYKTIRSLKNIHELTLTQEEFDLIKDWLERE